MSELENLLKNLKIANETPSLIEANGKRERKIGEDDEEKIKKKIKKGEMNINDIVEEVTINGKLDRYKLKEKIIKLKKQYYKKIYNNFEQKLKDNDNENENIGKILIKLEKMYFDKKID